MYWVDEVRLTNREDCCEERILGTVVMVYSSGGGSEVKVAHCGKKITGNTNLFSRFRCAVISTDYKNCRISS